MAKLTVDVDSYIIDQAKLYAKHRGISISQLVANYLTSIAPPAPNLAPVLRSVKGKKQHEDLQGYKKHIESKKP